MSITKEFFLENEVFSMFENSKATDALHRISPDNSNFVSIKSYSSFVLSIDARIGAGFDGVEWFVSKTEDGANAVSVKRVDFTEITSGKIKTEITASEIFQGISEKELLTNGENEYSYISFMYRSKINSPLEDGNAILGDNQNILICAKAKFSSSPENLTFV